MQPIPSSSVNCRAAAGEQSSPVHFWKSPPNMHCGACRSCMPCFSHSALTEGSSHSDQWSGWKSSSTSTSPSFRRQIGFSNITSPPRRKTASASKSVRARRASARRTSSLSLSVRSAIGPLHEKRRRGRAVCRLSPLRLRERKRATDHVSQGMAAIRRRIPPAFARCNSGRNTPGRRRFWPTESRFQSTSRP